METKAHHILIGAFVLLTLIGGLVFALWVARVSLDDEFDEYDVVFTETVTGLTKGALVNFNGIQVGEVRRLSLDRNDAAKVLARVRVDAGTPVKTDTSARLTYTGLTGVAIIELVAGTPDALPLLPAEDQEVAVIIAVPSAIQQFMTDGGDVLTRINETMVRIGEVLSEENTQRFAATLTHIESITAQFDADKAALGEALRRADQAFADLSAASTAFQELAAQGGTTMARVDQLLAQDFGPATDDLQQTLASLKEISARVEGLLSRNQGQIDQLAQQGVPELTAALADLRTLAASLQRVSERLEAAPADYLLQRDRPREYRPK
ncbi:MAG TPA: MlaD family protein [Xanthomonadales bacterium]|nr:MlaD family protein [Xanthomonadales bacterium]